ncbi:MAG: trimethylamine methyltransferase family protein [Actinobacteria bacterium]|nr:trimethylamine methyltransferase family protein [Actinomycetota bacterium]
MGVMLHVLDQQAAEAIRLTALEILERTGTRVEDARARGLMADHGAWVDGARVRIPSGMVTRALASAPPCARLVGRNGVTLTLGGDHVYFGTGSDCPQFLDPYTGERRPYSAADVAASLRVVDALPQLDFVMSMGLVQDVPPQTYDRHQFLAMVANTRKPMVVTAVDGRGLEDLHRMAACVVGGEAALRRDPLIALYAEPSSPLVHSRDALQKLMYAAEHAIPTVYPPPVPWRGARRPSRLPARWPRGWRSASPASPSPNSSGPARPSSSAGW